MVRPIQAVLDDHAWALMEVPGVRAIGIGTTAGHPCIRVIVASKTAEVESQIPSDLEGYIVDVLESGDLPQA